MCVEPEDPDTHTPPTTDQARHLVDTHVNGRASTADKIKLTATITAELDNGSPEPALIAALIDYARPDRERTNPGLLPHLISDALRATPTATASRATPVACQHCAQDIREPTKGQREQFRHTLPDDAYRADWAWWSCAGDPFCDRAEDHQHVPVGAPV